MWFFINPDGFRKVYMVLNKTVCVRKLGIVGIGELNDAYQKVLAWYFAHPREERGLNELVTILYISKTTASTVIQQLVDEGALKVKIIGRMWRVTWADNSRFKAEKIAYNLGRIYESGITHSIVELYPNAKAIILFGSYRKGDDVEESDLDIAVEITGNHDLQVIQLGVLQQLGYRSNVPVNLHVFSRNKIDLNLFANIANGIVLAGFLEVRP